MSVLVSKGVLKGHEDWVTSIAAPEDPDRTDMLVSSSRDKTVMLWDLTRPNEEQNEYGMASRGIRGHSHYVEDVILSSDPRFAISASWDRTLRLWNLNYGVCNTTFQGHTRDVLSVAFNPDNTRIISGGRDRTIRLWNTLGECRCSIDDAHNDWVSCVQFSPNPQNPFVISSGWDKLIKVWRIDNQNFRIDTRLVGHDGYINHVAASPDGSLCASGGKDKRAMLWDLNIGKHLYTLDAKDIINSLAFSPTEYWLVVGTDSGVLVWDLKHIKEPLASLSSASGEALFPPSERDYQPACRSIAWSADGAILYSGWTDSLIRVWGITA